jgi:hypothetical protein
VFTDDPQGRKNIVVEYNYVQEHIHRYYVLHESVCVCLAYFLDHDLWVCPLDMIKLIKALPFLRMFAWVGGCMDGCTNYKTQWQCPKSDREKTMLIVQQTFSKKLHQLSNTGKKPARRRKRVCEQHTDTQKWGQTPKESTYYIHVPGLLLQVFRE